MNLPTGAQVNAFISNTIFYVGPAFAVCVASYLLFPLVKDHLKDTDAAAIQAAAGGYLSYAVTAALFLIAMPRANNSFLTKIDSSGDAFRYAIAIALPAPISILTLIASTVKATNLALFGFLLATAYFIWSSAIMMVAVRRSIPSQIS